MVFIRFGATRRLFFWVVAVSEVIKMLPDGQVLKLWRKNPRRDRLKLCDFVQSRWIKVLLDIYRSVDVHNCSHLKNMKLRMIVGRRGIRRQLDGYLSIQHIDHYLTSLVAFFNMTLMSKYISVGVSSISWVLRVHGSLCEHVMGCSASKKIDTTKCTMY